MYEKIFFYFYFLKRFISMKINHNHFIIRNLFFILYSLCSTCILWSLVCSFLKFIAEAFFKKYPKTIPTERIVFLEMT